MMVHTNKTPFVVFNDGQPVKDAFRCGLVNKASIRREDLDLLVFGRQKVGQLSLSVFVPFSVLDQIMLGVFEPKLVNTTQNFMSVDQSASRLRSARFRKLLLPSWPACSAESFAGLGS